MTEAISAQQGANEEDIVDILENSTDPFIFLTGKAGSGKCLREGTRVIMFDGSIRKVEDVSIGDLLMGPDSSPRRVLAIHRGEEELYSVDPISSVPFVCTGNHVLSLTGTNDMRGRYRLATVNELIEQSKFVRADRRWKLYQVGVEFEEQETKLDPYIAGVWLADGSRGCSAVTTSQGEVIDAVKREANRLGLVMSIRYCDKKHTMTLSVSRHKSMRSREFSNAFLRETLMFLDGDRRKFIPREYLINSRKRRLELLAGLLDCDGYYANCGVEIVSYSPPLAEGIAFLARSLGFHVHVSNEIVKGYEHNQYARLMITGELREIPFRTIVPKERRQIKRHNVSGFDIRPAGVGRYVGFEIDGDNLFLLSDFTVTHNSSVVRRFTKSTRKDVLVCAPTGVAAVNCGGMTIHRMFGMQVRPFDDAYIKELSQRQKKAVKLADVLIIDEVSMLSSPMLDAIDQILRKCRRRADKPFGGLQIIAVGDLAQLPNVMKDAEWELYKKKFETPHFFSAPCFKTHPMKILNMVKIFRQSESEKDFLEILNGVRNGRLSQELLDKLNSRHRPNFTVQPGYVSLCPTNNMVDSVNSKELDKIPEAPVAYRAEVTGEFKPKDCLADELLTLKPGAQVMCLRNDASGRYVNGTIAVVDRCDRDQIIIDVNGEKIAIEQDLWESMQYETSQKDGVDVISQTVTGSMSQYPIKLAFAVSIHKSQGKTYDKCIVDPRGIFENGQLYVALSRCTTLSGLILKNKVLQNDIRVDERVVKWVAAMRQSGNWNDVHQKFIQQSNAPFVEKIATSAESLIERVSKGNFPTDSEIIEIAAMCPEELQEFGSKCVSVLLDEIQMRRLEIEKLKRDNASLKGKVTKYENSAKPKKSLFRERTFAEMDFEMGMQNDSEHN